jgi:hypothetical protein
VDRAKNNSVERAMSASRRLRRILVAALLVAAPCAGRAVHAEDRNTLINQANAPISNLLQIRLQDSYAPAFQSGANGQGNTFSISAVLPIRRLNVFPTTQIALLTVPAAVTVPSGVTARGMHFRGVTGFGDIRFLDLVVIAERNDFVVGVGPTFVFPSASERLTGQGKWQVGPAVGAGYTPVRELQLGVLAQNPISFADSKSKDEANALSLQPFITYHLGSGWFLKTEPQMLFDWETHKQLLPVNLGIGRVFNIGPQVVNCFIEPAWNIATDGPAPRYAITFGVFLLYPNFYD